VRSIKINKPIINIFTLFILFGKGQADLLLLVSFVSRLVKCNFDEQIFEYGFYDLVVFAVERFEMPVVEIRNIDEVLKFLGSDSRTS
jgi:hypothetical protein